MKYIIDIDDLEKVFIEKTPKYMHTNIIETLKTIEKIKFPICGVWEERQVDDNDILFKRRFYCSNCGNWNSYGKSLYCPHCGAKMKGRTSDE